MEALTPFTTAELKKYVLKNNPQFRVDEQSEKVFHLLCQYFANDPGFEKSGLSLTKGIMLTGPLGVGKTEFLRVFSKNKRQCFHMVSVYEIEAACHKNGIAYYQAYTGMVPGWGNTPQLFLPKIYRLGY